MGQKPPMAAAFQDVEDGVEDIAQGVGTWPSLGLWGEQVGTQTAPLSPGEVGWIPAFSLERAYETILTLAFTKQALSTSRVWRSPSCGTGFLATSYAAPSDHRYALL